VHARFTGNVAELGVKVTVMVFSLHGVEDDENTDGVKWKASTFITVPTKL
jgi:hypothetical protein